MDHSMDGMDMSSDSSSSSSMSMPMVFTNSHTTPLFSNTWTPSSTGAYAGTCIFLILLAIIDRSLFALKAVMERRWRAAHLNRRYIAIAGRTSESERIEADPNAKLSTLISAYGVEENVKVVHNVADGPIPWRFSVDFPRAGLVLCIIGISYLLMLAVMTQNIGYFCSVLAGAFLGELAIGRYIAGNDHPH
ncbi:Ctr copper transporter [Penicillium cosmopolitanum]|uniref:Copper transport protein n=1 Tax=Penicillium cosmopolitanum TaxID=1131564 RepID=A0A9W9VCA1_9EURO|nr:Ctr copper transporter [Penicillium cosmopolitanum]KAJ5376823.1 Ctr copper transporter [Penicillium cosmopolitanum]